MRQRVSGFSLVEILVGMVIGLLAVIVMMQVFSLSEASKRTATGGGDATTNGALALYSIQREAKMAGWGLESSLYMGRTVDAGNALLPGCEVYQHCAGGACPSADWSFAPIKITDGGTGPDTVAIRFFADIMDGNFVPAPVANVSGNVLDASSIPQLAVNSAFGCSKGDLVLVSSVAGNVCTLIQLSDDPVTTPAITLPHKSDSTNAPYNDPAWDAVTGQPPAVSGPGDFLATCFTPFPRGPSATRVFSVNSAAGTLQLTDTSGATDVTETIADNIIDLQAQYGLAADGSPTVTSWVDATSSWNDPVPKAGTAGNTTNNRLQNIKAVRIAVLARSAQFEKPQSGTVCDATKGTPGTPGASGWSTWATFDTDNYPTDWRCYRYRAFDLVVPIRNVIWGSQ